jgi:hypothetical protein
MGIGVGIAGGSVGEGLRNRRTAFLLGLGFAAIVVALAALTAPSPERASEPNALTLAFLVYGLGSVALCYWYFLPPDKVIAMADRTEPRPTLGRMAWLTSAIAVAGMIGPVVLGVILYQISGEVWRLALLGGVGLVGGTILYWRVGEGLRALANHGLSAWDPFGPNMD